MNPILANAYIPLAPLAPVGQGALLVLIIVFEALFIAKHFDASKVNGLWWKVALANVVTAVFGAVLALLSSMFEAWLVFGWGSQKHINAILWWFSCFLYGFVLPWIVWIICYHISWRSEAAILKRLLPVKGKEIEFRLSVRNSHRWSYGIIALIVLAGCLFYASILIQSQTT
jgi:hypothetical protein